MVSLKKVNIEKEVINTYISTILNWISDESKSLQVMSN